MEVNESLKNFDIEIVPVGQREIQELDFVSKEEEK